MSHLRVYWLPGVSPKFFVSALLWASGAKGSSPPLVMEDCGCWPAVAVAVTVVCDGIPEIAGRKCRATLAEAVTRINRYVFDAENPAVP